MGLLNGIIKWELLNGNQVAGLYRKTITYLYYINKQYPIIIHTKTSIGIFNIVATEVKNIYNIYITGYYLCASLTLGIYFLDWNLFN